LAAYAEPGQYFRFYELNADVLEFAERYFSYLRDCSGRYDVVLGDGRLSLESEPPQRFDLLVLDAFSGDAVPTHLLTKEAFEIYLRHLQPNATVAVNISNRYLDLSGVIAGLADHFGFRLRRVITEDNAELGQFSADWIVLSRGSQSAEQTLTADDESSALTAPPVLWTDDHSNLFEILK
jgi:spermidine synthase